MKLPLGTSFSKFFFHGWFTLLEQRIRREIYQRFKIFFIYKHFSRFTFITFLTFYIYKHFSHFTFITFLTFTWFPTKDKTSEMTERNFFPVILQLQIFLFQIIKNVILKNFLSRVSNPVNYFVLTNCNISLTRRFPEYRFSSRKMPIYLSCTFVQLNFDFIF